jgi:Rha family phage regulatory protein
MNNITTLTLDSREVADMVNKTHTHLLRDIDTYTNYLLNANETKIGLVEFFQKSHYRDGKGQNRPCYNITKKGCELIAHKMTGQKGVLFTAEYINRFHDMEAKLLTPARTFPQPKIYNGRLVYNTWDIAGMTGCNPKYVSVRFARSRMFTEGVDYVKLAGGELSKFKEQYHSALPKICPALIVVYLDSWEKLRLMFPALPEYEEIKGVTPLKLPAPAPVKLMASDRIDFADSLGEVRELIKMVRCELDEVCEDVFMETNPCTQTYKYNYDRLSTKMGIADRFLIELADKTEELCLEYKRLI